MTRRRRVARYFFFGGGGGGFTGLIFVGLVGFPEEAVLISLGRLPASLCLLDDIAALQELVGFLG